jgi:hypothetical protein
MVALVDEATERSGIASVLAEVVEMPSWAKGVELPIPVAPAVR